MIVFTSWFFFPLPATRDGPRFPMPDRNGTNV